MTLAAAETTPAAAAAAAGAAATGAAAAEGAAAAANSKRPAGSGQQRDVRPVNQRVFPNVGTKCFLSISFFKGTQHRRFFPKFLE